MRYLAPDDRPREKLARSGVDALGDNELLAIVLGHGWRRQTALDLANALLGIVGGVHGLTRTTRDELRRVAGIGDVRAAQLLAAVELGRRTLLRAPHLRARLALPRDVAAYLMPRYSARGTEQFGIVLLDARCRVVRTTVLSTGSVDATPVQPRDIFREAAACRASAIVLFHNHPSGDPTPSRDDVLLTGRLVRAGDVMGIDVVDHVILADNHYYSFREAGAMPHPGAKPGSPDDR